MEGMFVDKFLDFNKILTILMIDKIFILMLNLYLCELI